MKSLKGSNFIISFSIKPKGVGCVLKIVIFESSKQV